MLVRNTKTVRVGALLPLALLGLGCGQQTKPATTSPAPAASSPRASAPAEGQTPTSGAVDVARPAAASPPVGSTSESSLPARDDEPPRRSGSAYFGCGVPIPSAHSWDESSEDEVLDAIGAAKVCARSEGRLVLLEFVAPWCADCREMARLDEAQVVADTLRQRFERVRINVGRWDRHEALRESFGVRALATYIVLDPTTSKLLARTTLEPITRSTGRQLTADDWARWLREHS